MFDQIKLQNVWLVKHVPSYLPKASFKDYPFSDILVNFFVLIRVDNKVSKIKIETLVWINELLKSAKYSSDVVQLSQRVDSTKSTFILTKIKHEQKRSKELCVTFKYVQEETNGFAGKAFVDPCSGRTSRETKEDPDSKNEHIESGRVDI